jgi:hypothetical protein
MNHTDDYCILRVKKLCTFGSVAGSAAHTFREIRTPNADAKRTHLNWTIGASSSAKIVDEIKALLPQKRRKDAVLCLEYLITASPTWFTSVSETAQQGYFERAIEWLKDRHNAKNIVCLNYQLDEKSPHLVAYIVPLLPDGRLTAKEFVGGRAKLSMMQTDFWNKVGKPFNLSRGLLGSTAKHITAKQYSAALHEKEIFNFPVAPEISFLDRLNGNAAKKQSEYRRLINKHKRIVEQIYNLAKLKEKSRLEKNKEQKNLVQNNEELEKYRNEIIQFKEKETKFSNDLKVQGNEYSKIITEISCQLSDAHKLIESLSKDNDYLKFQNKIDENKILELRKRVSQIAPICSDESPSP